MYIRRFIEDKFEASMKEYKAVNNYLSILETLGAIFFEHSYSNNLLKRTTNVNRSMIKSFETVKVESPYTIGSGVIICPIIDRVSKLDDTNYIIPVGCI